MQRAHDTAGAGAFARESAPLVTKALATQLAKECWEDLILFVRHFDEFEKNGADDDSLDPDLECHYLIPEDLQLLEVMGHHHDEDDLPEYATP
jgi:hypothetical protein